MKRSLRSALTLHRSAADDLLSLVDAIPDESWKTPVADGKWSPAEIVEHLNCTYDIILSELDGGAGMQIRTSLIQRLVLRLTVVPRILITGKFPGGARAPKETRPVAPRPLDREELVEAFRAKADGLEQKARLADPKQKVTHAYFGTSSVASGVRMCARHIEHHAAQLPQTNS